ncbi:MAG: AraC family transcriptional regulator [Lachnospiraceae bacterium]|nr:AraC family transcriptional regulator [Lachnospiraceae bacterium]
MAISRYSLDNPGSDHLSARLLYVTYSKYENDWHSRPHTHPFAELCYIKRGRGYYQIEEEAYPVEADNFVIINANVSHTEMSSGEIPLEYIILGVEGIQFSFGKNREHIIFDCRQGEKELLFYMDTLLKEMEEKNENYELVCQNLLEVLIVRLNRRASFSSDHVAPVRSSRECIRLKQYIEMNYTQPGITLDTLARITHLNKYYMVHEFTRYFDLSPISYLNEVRIKASKELLSSTDYSITDVAIHSGFSSPSYFAQCFRKYCGMSASDYRKDCRMKKSQL